jgi:hypothetical protein
MIDTLAMYQKLKASGLQSKQAEAITRAICLAHSARVADLNAKKMADDRPGLS